MKPKDFWSRVKIGAPDECWEWQSHRNERGYGRITSMRWRNGEGGPRMLRAHRLAYELHYGVDPGELHVLHSCDNPPCCNPKHLRLGTQADNIRDRVERHRSNPPKGEQHKLAKLTEAKVREIRSRFVRGRKGDGTRAAREFGVSATIIRQILRGEIWRHVQ